jgi:hypothetical protein
VFRRSDKELGDLYNEADSIAKRFRA